MIQTRKRFRVNLGGFFFFGTSEHKILLSLDFGNKFDVGFLGYELKMRAATGSGDHGGNALVTPSLDDVTLTVYLPSAQYLLTELMD